LSVVEDSSPAAPSPQPVPVRLGATRAGPPREVVLRKDRWWVQPLVTGLGLLAFIVYATWAAFRNGNYFVGLDHGRNYLSPLYSPCLAANCPPAVRWGPITPANWTITPAILILIFPLGFRLTCYYYRKTYYRAFWLSPPACTVADAGSTKPGGLRSRYTGETRFPLVLQNIHRYFWYFTLIFAGLLTYDAIEAFRFPGGVGMGIGTLIFVVNAVFIWAYQLGCHACRHLFGGGLRRFSKAPVRLWIWTNLTTPLNKHHQLFAWLSLVSIVVTDFYVYLVASGAFNDPRIF
jgi:hypothetical protein